MRLAKRMFRWHVGIVMVCISSTMLLVSCGGDPSPGPRDPGVDQVATPTALPQVQKAPVTQETPVQSAPARGPTATAAVPAGEESTVRRDTATASPTAVPPVATPTPEPDAATAVESPTPDDRASETVTEQQSEALMIDSLNRKAMAEVMSFDVSAFLLFKATTGGTLWLEGRLAPPGNLWLEVVKRKDSDPKFAAGERGARTILLERGWAGMQSIIGPDGVHVRYRDHGGPGGLEPLPEAQTTDWYRLQYSDWSAEQPDVFTDPSGILARILPYLVVGFPAPNPDPEFTMLIETERIDGRIYFIPRAFEATHGPEDIYLIVYRIPFESHPTGVKRDIGSVWRYIDRETHRTMAIVVNSEIEARDSAQILFTNFDDPAVEPIKIPEEALVFDRSEHAELR